MGETYTAEGWEEALAVVKHLGPGASVAVPKSTEPSLPPDLELRSSNFPWSIHKGARRVYREDSPGEHLQIREYLDRWTVAVDNFNPHHRPIGHARNDVSTGAVATLPLFATVQTVRVAGQLTTSLVERQGQLLTQGLIPMLSRVLRF
ncbi:hypothetical protein [Halorientalis litorea]|uniref:hypothetical protein n=1 Tax=Halorientalis litorea TaxID=2931977 RepID=UPI001FF4A127|nr:hypothetical protein [Halorientalis litorea]